MRWRMPTSQSRRQHSSGLTGLSVPRMRNNPILSQFN